MLRRIGLIIGGVAMPVVVASAQGTDPLTTAVNAALTSGAAAFTAFLAIAIAIPVGGLLFKLAKRAISRA